LHAAARPPETTGVIPEPRYVKTDDGVYIAYQVVGDGPIDISMEHAWLGGLELMWEDPYISASYDALGSFSRLILHDRRATGLSSRNVPPPTLETRVGDLIAVLDAIGSERTALLGSGEGGAPLALFASIYPDRTHGLIWWWPAARSVWAPDYPWGDTPDVMERELHAVRELWGTRAYGRAWAEQTEIIAGGGEFSPRLEEELVQIARVSRHWATPDVAEELERIWYETDVRGVLPLIRIPTMLMCRDLPRLVEEATYIGGLIPGSRVVSFPGTQLGMEWEGMDAIADEIRHFIGAERPVRAIDRMLATVLFTDIVGSTEKAAELGDHRWHQVLEGHNTRVRAQLQRFHGREIDTAGDGFFATFDGPARAVVCAQAIGDSVRELSLEIRAGCHTGEIELDADSVRGIAVHIGARVTSMAGPGEVLVSSTVKDLVAGSGLVFEDRGEHELKGVPGKWRLYAVASD
jgi:class 3 adenylate cyclase/pimeloyl-ACP methyl ester carboxylesterase